MKKIVLLIFTVVLTFALFPFFAEEYTIGSITALSSNGRTEKKVNFRYNDDEDTYFLQVPNLFGVGWIFLSEQQLEILRGIISKSIEWGKIVEENKVAVNKSIPDSEITSKVTWLFGNSWHSANRITLKWAFHGLEKGAWFITFDSTEATSNQNQFVTYSTEITVITQDEVVNFGRIIAKENIENAKSDYAKKKKNIDLLFSDTTKEVKKQPIVKAPISGSRIYFIRLDTAGVIIRDIAYRNLNTVSLQSVTDSLLSGLTEQEKKIGFISLIPDNTILLSAEQKNNVALLNFDKMLENNPYGPEGAMASLMQIVFTATEIPDITSVQILVDGQKKNYLSEGVFIGHPLTRDSF